MKIEQFTRLKEYIIDSNLASYWEGYYMFSPEKDAHAKHAFYKQKVKTIDNFIDAILLELCKEVKI